MAAWRAAADRPGATEAPSCRLAICGVPKGDEVIEDVVEAVIDETEG